jgi:hypothetical protein
VHCMPWVAYCKRGQLTPPAADTSTLAAYPDTAPAPSTGQRIHMQKPLFLAAAALAVRAIGPHFLVYAHEDLQAQYSKHLKCPFPWAKESVLSLRHYRSRSREEYVQRRRGGDAAYSDKHYTDAQLALEWQQENDRCVPAAATAGTGSAAGGSGVTNAKRHQQQQQQQREGE